jgi:hypothetical protein
MGGRGHGRDATACRGRQPLARTRLAHSSPRSSLSSTQQSSGSSPAPNARGLSRSVRSPMIRPPTFLDGRNDYGIHTVLALYFSPEVLAHADLLKDLSHTAPRFLTRCGGPILSNGSGRGSHVCCRHGNHSCPGQDPLCRLNMPKMLIVFRLYPRLRDCIMAWVDVLPGI